MHEAVHVLDSIVSANRSGTGTGICSICSAHPMVIEAAMKQAYSDGTLLLIESTSNQVDQFGGYTGMTPSAFHAYIAAIADRFGFPREQLLLGGDHLGPNSWQHEAAAVAMSKACTLTAAYAEAGYSKIHLDASMFCADDPGDRSKPLDDELAAARSADMCLSAEQAWKASRHRDEPPRYVIGTEVPVPGGAKEQEDSVEPTRCEAARRTIEITEAAFLSRGLEDAWERVIGLVVQPGVEFGDEQVFLYDHSCPEVRKLTSMITDYDHLVYEAHSTDYQTEQALTQLTEDHFAILKVGPWLTFTYREAVFSLSRIEDELAAFRTGIEPSGIREALDRIMVAEPRHWARYYQGTPAEQAFKRNYSFSDRIRYYWPNSEIVTRIDRLTANLEREAIPLSLLSQYFPKQYSRVCEGSLSAGPRELILNRIEDVLGIYSRACRGVGR